MILCLHDLPIQFLSAHHSFPRLLGTVDSALSSHGAARRAVIANAGLDALSKVYVCLKPAEQKAVESTEVPEGGSGLEEEKELTEECKLRYVGA